jgi:UDP-N-acetylglucosamine--N-acetylmuramyl-(pentapeptide) pyrophosphoryl-undecaprenol N-acetylglucosamine transferase
MNHILLAGGGTGGHIYPGLAVADNIKEIAPDTKIVFAHTTRKLDEGILKNFSGDRLVQPIQPFSIRPSGLIKFMLNWRKACKLIRAWLKFHPTLAVLGLGGFGSAAAIYEASKMGIRTAFLNPDFVPGRANLWLSKFADEIFVQWSGTQRYFSRPVNVIGVPLRKEVCQLPDKSKALKKFGLDPAMKTLVITGGSTGARSLNDAVIAVLLDLAPRMKSQWQILFITGSQDYDRIRSRLNGNESLNITLLPYASEMEYAWSAADAAICRAGAITLAELTAAGIPSILLPYPYHRDNHQAKNASVLTNENAAFLVEDDKVAGEKTVSSLREHLTGILFDDAQRQAMATAATNMKKIDAAEKVAKWLIGT